MVPFYPRSGLRIVEVDGSGGSLRDAGANAWYYWALRAERRPVKIALFVTCVTDTLFPATGEAVVSVLERLGHDIDFPADQTCCGQMHINSGYAPQALALLKRMVRVFGDAELVVSPSASCTALIRTHYPKLAASTGDGGLVAAAQSLADRTYELSELLLDVLGVEDVGARFPHRVTYHPSCHGLRMLRLGDRPERLLRAVRGLELIELPEGEDCCGFGGTFAIKNAHVSEAMLVDKLGNVQATGAEFCVATDNSCLMHIGGGLTRRGLPIRALHLAEVLAATR
jgi:L-lactate dehydrogenase complex protein LldE